LPLSFRFYSMEILPMFTKFTPNEASLYVNFKQK